MNEDTDYVSHFLRVHYQDFPAIFTSRLEKKGGVVEVDMIRSANGRNPVVRAKTK